jgi:Calx-beta domain/Trypsin
MVTTTANPTASWYQANPGEGYDGTVRISSGTSYASGVLLYGGRALLTVAHLFDDQASDAEMTFQTSEGERMVSSAEILRHPEYDGLINNDLALVWLANSAPVAADRHELYRGSDELGQVFTLVGYGATGTGDAGWSRAPGSALSRLRAENQFDLDAADLHSELNVSWSPLAGTQLVADFDNGAARHDALGLLLGTHDLGLGVDEGLIASGDSGGPAFLNDQVAGIASYTANLFRGGDHPDVDAEINSSFGEIAAWQRISAYQQWIDQNLRDRYVDAPISPDDVDLEITEGDGDTAYVYFLLQFTGTRGDPDVILSVDFATRNGTAQAGTDYIGASGTLVLYPDEDHAVIPVEIIGDNIAEEDEVFFLDVFNPIGGSFGPGVSSLTAMRSILDDDLWLV